MALLLLDSGDLEVGAISGWGANYPDSVRLLLALGIALVSAGRSDEAYVVLEQAAATSSWSRASP